MKGIIHKKDAKSHNMKIRTPLAPVGESPLGYGKAVLFGL